MPEKISGIPITAVVGDLGATTTALESSTAITTMPVTRKLTLGVLASWLFQVGGLVSPTTVNFAASPYAVLITDQTLLVTTAGGVVVLTLPAAPSDGRTLIIKRTTTDVNAITVARNTKNIEGAASNLTINGGNLASITLKYDATSGSWWII